MSESAIKIGIPSLAYIEQFYADYRRDPASVPAEWRAYFTAAGNGNGDPVQLGPAFKTRSLFNPPETARPGHAGLQPDIRAESISERLHQLVRNYRSRGHIIAAVN